MTLPVHWVESLAGVGPATRSRSRATRPTTRSPYAGCARASGWSSPTAPVRRSRAPCARPGSAGSPSWSTTSCTCPSRSRAVTVVQALPKGDRGELAVEVLTEVGVATVVPWAAARSVAVWRGERAEKSLARWRATAREAAKQSRRAWFPVVEPLATTEEVCRLVGAADLAVVLHEEATTALAALPVPAHGRWSWSSGPRAGSPTTRWRRSRAAGAHAVRLGDEVLRTSTAGVVAVAALLARTGRWAT